SGLLFCSAQRARCAGWQRPIDRREDFVASLDHLVRRQGTTARLLPHVIILGAGPAKLNGTRGTAIDRSHLHVQRRPRIRKKSGNAASPFLARLGPAKVSAIRPLSGDKQTKRNAQLAPVSSDFRVVVSWGQRHQRRSIPWAVVLGWPRL